MNQDDRLRELELALAECLRQNERLAARIAELENSKTWRLQRALAAGRLGDALGALLEKRRPRSVSPVQVPHVETDGRPLVVLVLPWLAWGGVEQLALDLIAGLDADFRWAVVATDADRHERRADFERLTPLVYCLSDLGEPAPADFLVDFCRRNQAAGVIVSSAPRAYPALPRLDSVWRAQILHNTAPEGSLGPALQVKDSIDLHFAVGPSQAEALRKAGVAADRIVEVPNGVDAQGRFDPARYADRRAATRAELGFEPKDFVVAFVGRLAEEKAPELYVRSLAELQRMRPETAVRGLILGDGPERPRVERLLRETGLEPHVRRPGFSPRAPELLAAADAFLLPSRIEGTPLALLEAMSLEIPAVAADVGGVSRVLRHEAEGLLVNERRPEAFATALAGLLDDPGRAGALAKAARSRVLRDFDWSATLGAYRNALEVLK